MDEPQRPTQVTTIGEMVACVNRNREAVTRHAMMCANARDTFAKHVLEHIKTLPDHLADWVCEGLFDLPLSHLEGDPEQRMHLIERVRNWQETILVRRRRNRTLLVPIKYNPRRGHLFNRLDREKLDLVHEVFEKLGITVRSVWSGCFIDDVTLEFSILEPIEDYKS